MFWFVFFWILCVAGLDAAKRWIPNFLSLGGAVVALLWLVLHGHTLFGHPWLDGLAGFALALLFTVPGCVLRMMGAGDVKFLAAFGLMAGWQAVLVAVAIGGLVSIVFVVIWKNLVLLGWMRDKGKKRFLPMGLFFGVGMIAALLRV